MQKYTGWMESTEGRRSVVDSRQNWLVVQLQDSERQLEAS